MSPIIYLDNAATTACAPEVVAAMLPYFTQYYGNPGTNWYVQGAMAAAAVAGARKIIAAYFNAAPEEIIFTSGATEACNLAIKGVWEAYQTKGTHIITAATEHKAVLNTCKTLQKKGATLTILSVDENGQINLDELRQAITPQTILIALMYGNNETGVLHPVAAISQIAQANNILFFCDATQAAGKVEIDVKKLGIPLLACSAHKMHGPKGIGMLYKSSRNPRVTILPQTDGGNQENGLRSGTLNVPAIAGFGKAVELAASPFTLKENMAQLRGVLEKKLADIEGACINGAGAPRLPHITNISFLHVPAQRVLTAISSRVAASSGSACSAGSLDPSHVLTAMGITAANAKTAIRLSLGRYTTLDEVEQAATIITEAIAALRQEDPVWQLYKQGLLP